jgi:valyl-tRNA synthetase
VAQVKEPVAADVQILEKATLLKATITGLRDTRNKQQIKPKESIDLFIQTTDEITFKAIESILAKQVNAKNISYTNEQVAGCITTVIGKNKFYIKTEQPINTANQKEDLEKELNHLKGFLISVDKKLANGKFVANAKPEVLALEQKKKADALSKIKIIEESLATL